MFQKGEKNMHSKPTPLYDLFEGLGRRRALRKAGFDPDVLVYKNGRMPQEVPCKDEEKEPEEAA